VAGRDTVEGRGDEGNEEGRGDEGTVAGNRDRRQLREDGGE